LSAAEEAVDVELLGRQAHHHIVAEKRYTEKVSQHRVAAGMCLLQAKPHVPHGSWLTYLARHRIKERTAQDRMRFASMKPEERAAFLDGEAARLREYRAAAPAKSAVRTADLKPAGQGTRSVVRPKRNNVTSPEVLRAIRHIKQATPEQLRAVLAIFEERT
jgi:hypothetical protein